MVPAGQGGEVPSNKFAEATKGRPVFIYDPVRGTDPESALAIWSAAQELNGNNAGGNSVLQEFLVGAALISHEAPDAINSDGDPEGVPGGACRTNCVRGTGVGIGYIAVAVVGVLTGVGKQKAKEALTEAGEKIADAARSLKELAAEIREAGRHAAARNRRTIAVGRTKSGDLIAGSSNGFDKGQRAAAERLGAKRVPSKKGNHAEENLMDARDDLEAVGTSERAPCGPGEHNCGGKLLDRGIKVEE